MEKTTPSAGTAVNQNPAEVRLQFDEAIQNEAPFIAVLDSKGHKVQIGRAEINKQNGHIVSVRLQKHLSKGIYTVNWRVISADGHPVGGTFMFGIGEHSAALQGGAPSAQSFYRPSLAMVGDRFLLYGGMAVFVGTVLLLTYLLSLNETLLPQERKGIKWAQMLASWAIILSVLLNLPLQVATLRSVSWTNAFQPRLMADVLAHSSAGKWWPWQVLLAILLALSVRAVYRFHCERLLRWWLPSLLLFIVLAWIKASMGHASENAADSAAVTTIDTMHILSASLWTGGLFMIGLLFALSLNRHEKKQRRKLLTDVLRAFAYPALAGVGGVIASGVLMSMIFLSSVDQLVTTGYGRLLLAKIICFVLMGLLGLWHFGRIRVSGKRTISAGTLLLEQTLGAVVLVIAAVLTNVQTPPPPKPVPFYGEERAGNIDVQLRVSPAVVGENVFTVRLRDQEGRPFTKVQQVEMRTKKQIGAANESDVILKRTGNGDYQGKGLYISSSPQLGDHHSPVNERF
ncbi:copper resistance protein CopC [Terrilactibacillus sp. S3-3]|nr:copper resistance protein CopC [Terrilactibacillus sp. S3-3]